MPTKMDYTDLFCLWILENGCRYQELLNCVVVRGNELTGSELTKSLSGLGKGFLYVKNSNIWF
jgi:hypothetical protein